MTLGKLAMAATILAASVTSACAGHRYYGGGYYSTAPGGFGVAYGGYVRTAPPPLRYESYGAPPGPGYVWAPGYWDWRPAGGWYWRGGTWLRPPRARAAWAPGRWHYHGGRGYGWRPGHWR